MTNEVAAESHHRVKNTLQSIVALVSILSGAKGFLDKDDVKRMLTHVYNLSSLHDALYEAALTSSSLNELNLESVCTRILQRFECDYKFSGDFVTTPRIVSTVSLIISDVLTSLSLQSVEDVECIGYRNADTEYTIQFLWKGALQPGGFIESPSLQLAKMVLSSEMQGLFYQVEMTADSNLEEQYDKDKSGIGFVIKRQQ